MENKKNSEPKPQGGKSSQIDRWIPNQETGTNDKVVLKNLCELDSKVDSFLLPIDINNTNLVLGEIVQIPIEDIRVSEIHLKLYESDQKRDKIEELKVSISEVGQLQPISVCKFLGQYYLIDGKLRKIAMSELGMKTIAAIISPSVNDGDTLDDLIVQHHIRKELTTDEKLNEIIEILQIGKDRKNKYIGIDKLRKIVSKKLGSGFSRSKVIELGEIIDFELKNDFGHIFSKAIIDRKIKVSDGLTLINTFKELDYTSDNEKESSIIKGFINKQYDLEEANKLTLDYKGKKGQINPIDYPQRTGSYEIRQGNIFDVDITDQTFDVVFSSPPYSLQRKYGDNVMVEVGVEKNVDDYIKNICDAFEKAYNQLSETGSMFVNINDTWKNGFSLNVIEKFVIEMDRRGIRKVQMIQWEKPNPKPQGNKVHRYVNKFECIIHFAKSCDHLWNTIGKVKDTLKVQKGCKEEGTKKQGYSISNMISACQNLLSENMIEGLDGLSEFTSSIKNDPKVLKRQFEAGEEKHTATFNPLLPLIPLLSTLPKDRQGTVCDPFAGTSTTGETALALGHKFIGVELYESNCKTSARVLSQAEEKFKDFNLKDELFENLVKISNVG